MNIDLTFHLIILYIHCIITFGLLADDESKYRCRQAFVHPCHLNNEIRTRKGRGGSGEKDTRKFEDESPV